ncbi:MAG: HDIG domain-containing protein, partial [Spirochaetaceae bacterium]|nr:HDIG domain-containing protein [Spirochaetaceae bacterium]
ASLELAITNTIYLVLLYIIFRGSVEKIALFDILGIAFNGFISGILALGFLTPLESLLNTASVFRLMDLSDLNSPLMKKMLLTAPGTYNHSMLVATLAENAAHAIGANALLARVGAYYHDIGKLEQPEYFVENQREGNKHDEINPRLSVSVIRRHVKKGKEKAQQMRFPQEVIDIISQHHGNSVIGYFYAEAKKLDENVSPEEFSYQEDPPSSRESAIVMLADTVEASTRTLERPSVSRLEKFIRQRIMEKYEHHQLDKSALTFNDLDTILDSFVKILGGYYHSRIEYPNQKDPDEVDTQDNSGEKTEDK